MERRIKLLNEKQANLLSSSPKIPQVGRRLAGFGRHQVAVRAHHVGFVADHHVRVVLGAIDEVPFAAGSRW